MTTRQFLHAFVRTARPSCRVATVRTSTPRNVGWVSRSVRPTRLEQSSPYTTSASLRKEAAPVSPEIQPSILYNFADIQEFTTSPSPNRILIDVREPSELLENGTIPSAKNIPVTTSPDAFFLSAEEFEDKFGFERPGKGDEVVFFCKAGVRSKAAARLAQQAGFGGKTGEYPGSWMDWVSSGGKVQR